MMSGNHKPKILRESNGEQPRGRQSPVGRVARASAEDLNTVLADESELSLAELAEIWNRRAYALAEEPPALATSETVDLLLFRLGGERYGIEVTGVREIYSLEQLTPLPRTPNFVAGIFSARGRILSVIDLRAFFGLPAVDLSDQTKIMVVTHTDLTLELASLEVGLLADDVVDVMTLPQEDIEPPLTASCGNRADYIQGITADLLVVLNLNTLLNDKRLIVHEEVG
jgi:purine-binding chemotaxis protein CheW